MILAPEEALTKFHSPMPYDRCISNNVWHRHYNRIFQWHNFTSGQVGVGFTCVTQMHTYASYAHDSHTLSALLIKW